MPARKFIAFLRAIKLCHKKFSESLFSGAKLEKALGMATTIRNVSTVGKLAAKYAGAR